MLMLCAFIWGTAFVAQSAGSGMGAYSFLAGRSWLAVLVLLPTVRACVCGVGGRRLRRDGDGMTSRVGKSVPHNGTDNRARGKSPRLFRVRKKRALVRRTVKSCISAQEQYDGRPQPSYGREVVWRLSARKTFSWRGKHTMVCSGRSFSVELAYRMRQKQSVKAKGGSIL